MTEAAAGRLTPARAAELVRVLDLQAGWENLRADGSRSTAQLRALQAAFEAYRVCMAAYVGRGRGEPVPELSPARPDRLGAWSRTVRAVLSRAEGGACPTHLVEKAHHAAGRIAARLGAGPAARETPTDLTGAIRQLDAVIAWCEVLGDGPARD